MCACACAGGGGPGAAAAACEHSQVCACMYVCAARELWPRAQKGAPGTFTEIINAAGRAGLNYPRDANDFLLAPVLLLLLPLAAGCLYDACGLLWEFLIWGVGALFYWVGWVEDLT